MPFCPQCREEYDSTVSACADCECELLESLDGIPEPEVPLPGAEHIEQEVRIFAEGAELAEAFSQTLLRAGVPTFLYEDPLEVEGRTARVLAVPADFGERVFAMLRAFPYVEVETSEGSGRLYLSRESLYEDAPEVLRLDDDAIVERGASVHADLVQVALEGEPFHRARAVRLLDRTGPEGRALLWGILREAAEAGKRNFVSDFLNLLQGITLSPPDEEIRRLLDHAQPEVRAAGVLLVGGLEGRAGSRRLVPLLEDDDGDVRDDAIEALFSLFGEDFGFDPRGNVKDRARAVGRWRRWLE